MRKWIRVACLAVGAGLAFASAADAGKEAAGTAAAPAGARAGTVVEIKPNRIVLMDITRAGERLVAVGERGFALLSDDAGQTWRAVGTPVTRTLTGVAFNDDQLGVAVGHGGMLARTEDGGATWTEVPLDEAAGESLLGVTALGGGKFAAYGAFGFYFDSTDGGKTWTRRIVMSEEFDRHISQLVPVGGTLWLIGESGTLARSDDGGATWQKIEIGTTASFNGGRTLADGRIVLVGNAGLVATSTDNGQSFEIKWSPAGRGYSAVAEAGGGLIVAGEAGVGVLDMASLVKK
jgi:photosystem II stability/assembly factor-like uncharacterized protein